jgi:hypothetical protein
MEIITLLNRQLGLTQKILASLLGISHSLLRQVAIGHRTLPSSAWSRLEEIRAWWEKSDEANVLSLPEMDATWRNRQIRNLEAKRAGLELALERENEAILHAQAQLKLADWITANPGGPDLERERMGRELMAHLAQMRLKSPGNQKAFWELRLRLASVQAQLELLDKMETGTA